MTAPHPIYSCSRLNLGGYGARVLWVDRDVEAERWAGERKKMNNLARMGILPWGFKVEQVAAVSVDGSLTVEPEQWKARHYRRAVMGGAGVYQMSLRAFLLQTRPVRIPAMPEALAAPFTPDLNTVEVFERFKWAARGKVRHSVRWKTGRRPRRRLKLEVLAGLKRAGLMADRKAAGRRGLTPYSPAKTARARREMQKLVKDEMRQELYAYLFPEDETEDNPTGVDQQRLDDMISMAGMLEKSALGKSSNGRTPYCVTIKDLSYEPGILAFLLVHKNRLGLKGFVKAIQIQRLNLRNRLIFLERQAYRTFLVKRVKPTPRRHRIRRPLYARPRPPSAPLAPPVL